MSSHVVVVPPFYDLGTDAVAAPVLYERPIKPDFRETPNVIGRAAVKRIHTRTSSRNNCVSRGGPGEDPATLFRIHGRPRSQPLGVSHQSHPPSLPITHVLVAVGRKEPLSRSPDSPPPLPPPRELREIYSNQDTPRRDCEPRAPGKIYLRCEEEIR